MSPRRLVEAITAIEVTQERFPDLDWEGFYPIKTRAGLRELPQHNPSNLPEQVATAIAFLRLCAPTKSANNIRAYALKHWAEDWGAANGMESYVPTARSSSRRCFWGFPSGGS